MRPPCRRGDGSYPDSKWEWILQLEETVAIAMLGGYTVTNKEFYVIPRDGGDYNHMQWVENGREHKMLLSKEFYPNALAIYKHDGKWWLIRLR